MLTNITFAKLFILSMCLPLQWIPLIIYAYYAREEYWQATKLDFVPRYTVIQDKLRRYLYFENAYYSPYATAILIVHLKYFFQHFTWLNQVFE